MIDFNQWIYIMQRHSNQSWKPALNKSSANRWHVEPGVWMHYWSPPHRHCRKGGIPQVSKSYLVHYRLARSLHPYRVIVCNGHFVVAGDTGGSSISLPGQTVTPLFGRSEHTEKPQLVSPVISLPCHMICAVCNNTQGAGACPVRKWDDPWLTA